MNKNAIKSYANYAHDQLVNQIKLKALVLQNHVHQN